MARVEKNAAAGQFEMQVDGETALVQYRDEGDGRVCLIHTEVPQALEGGGALVPALPKGYLRQSGPRAGPSCRNARSSPTTSAGIPSTRTWWPLTVRDQSFQCAPSPAMNFSDSDEDRSLGRGTGGTGGTTRGTRHLKGNR